MRTLRLGGIPFLILTLMSLAAALCASCSSASAQEFASSIALASAGKHSTALASIKRLPDGAYVYVNQKVVTCVQGNFFYIGEPDRSAGIKVDLGSNYTPGEMGVGNLATVSGLMATEHGERVILLGDVLQCDFTSTARIRPLGMNTAAILGWPINFREPDGPRVTGLVPTGQYIKIWGRVSRAGGPDEQGFWYCYIDDGWAKKDGTDANAPGIRVYSSNSPPVSSLTWTAVGVLSSMLWDPTPKGAEGDEVIIPCIWTTYAGDLSLPGSGSVAENYGSASGRVRLVGQQAPGKDVRIYSERGSIIVPNVTDQWTPFNLSGIPESGTPVGAGSGGYISAARDVNIGDTNVDFELLPSAIYLEIGSDKQSIAVCSDESALISALLRDCEGKGIEGRQVKLTTTVGLFTETGAVEFIGTTGPDGTLRAHLTAGSDNAGVAVVRAQTYPTPDSSSELSIGLKGPELEMSASPKIMSSAGSSVITAHIATNGAPVPGVPIAFSADREIFVESGSGSYNTLTNSAGEAQATLLLTAPGTARVFATHTNACSHETVSWATVAYAGQPWYAPAIQRSHPMVIDLDGMANGKKEVVLVTGEGYLVALNSDAGELWSRGKFGSGNCTASCAPVDSDRSGRPCVFVPVENQQSVYAYSYQGKPLAGWPAKSRYSFLDVACAIGDINLDGSPEIVGGDQSCYVFSWNPTGHWSGGGDGDASCLWVNLTGSPNTVIHSSTCALGDLDGDPHGILDVVVGTVSAPGNVFGFPGDAWGNYASNGFYLTDWPKLGGNRVETSPAIGDIDGDGKNDVAWGAEDGSVHIWLSSTGSQRLCPTGGAVMSSPALADLDGDGKLDVIAGSNSGYVFAFNWLGQSLQGWSGGIRLNSSGIYAIEAPVTVGDVTGDGQPDVVAACSDGFVYALYADGVDHEIDNRRTGAIAWAGCCVPPTVSTVNLYNAPVIDDVDNDGNVDILVAGSKGIYLFHLAASYANNPSLYPWPTFHGDNRRSGCATPEPASVNASIQGIVSFNGTPVSGAKVYIYKNDGSPVYVPHSSPPVERSYVLSVGSADPTAVGLGAYCISQLSPNETYNIKAEAVGYTTKWIENIAVTTGLTRVDVAL